MLEGARFLFREPGRFERLVRSSSNDPAHFLGASAHYTAFPVLDPCTAATTITVRACVHGVEVAGERGAGSPGT